MELRRLRCGRPLVAQLQALAKFFTQEINPLKSNLSKHRGNSQMKELSIFEQQIIAGGDGPPQSWIDDQRRETLRLFEELKRLFQQ
jgi:hypothetical protein